MSRRYRCRCTVQALGPHLGDRCLHGLQSLLVGQLQRLCLPLVLEQHQRLQQAAHLLCRKTGAGQSSRPERRGQQGRRSASTSHPVHGGDELAQSAHQGSVFQGAPFLQTQPLPLGFAAVLRGPPAGRRRTSAVGPAAVLRVSNGAGLLTMKCGSCCGSIWSPSTRCWLQRRGQRQDNPARLHLERKRVPSVPPARISTHHLCEPSFLLTQHVQPCLGLLFSDHSQPTPVSRERRHLSV